MACQRTQRPEEFYGFHAKMAPVDWFFTGEERQTIASAMVSNRSLAKKDRFDQGVIMGGGGGKGGSTPAPVAAPTPAPVPVAPPPPPAPVAPTPTDTQGDATAASNAKLRAMAGQQSTILNTDSLGNTNGTSAATPTAKTLLGT